MDHGADDERRRPRQHADHRDVDGPHQRQLRERLERPEATAAPAPAPAGVMAPAGESDEAVPVGAGAPAPAAGDASYSRNHAPAPQEEAPLAPETLEIGRQRAR